MGNTQCLHLPFICGCERSSEEQSRCTCVCARYTPSPFTNMSQPTQFPGMLGLGQLTADWPANISAPPSHSRCIWTQHQFVVWILHVDLVLLKHIREQQTDLVVSMPRGGKAYTACFEHSNLLANEIGRRGASAWSLCTSEPRTSFGRLWCLLLALHV